MRENGNTNRYSVVVNAGTQAYLCININKWEIEISYQNGEFFMKNSKAFYRSALATAIVMAFLHQHSLLITRYQLHRLHWKR